MQLIKKQVNIKSTKYLYWQKRQRRQQQQQQQQQQQHRLKQQHQHQRRYNQRIIVSLNKKKINYY